MAVRFVYVAAETPSPMLSKGGWRGSLNTESCILVPFSVDEGNDSNELACVHSPPLSLLVLASQSTISLLREDEVGGWDMADEDEWM